MSMNLDNAEQALKILRDLEYWRIHFNTELNSVSAAVSGSSQHADSREFIAMSLAAFDKFQDYKRRSARHDVLSALGME